MRFDKTQFDQPAASYQAHFFGATTGWGGGKRSSCCDIDCLQVAPYWGNVGSSLAPVFAGKEQQEHDYDTNGNLLLVHVWTYANHCPPDGVSNSGNNGNDARYNPGQTQLISELDQNNPVVVCDPRVIEEQTYQVDGVATLSGYATNANVVYKDVHYEHDKDNQGVSTYDYGNLDNTDATGNDVGGNHFVTHTTFYPHDDLTGQVVYLTDLPAITQTRDGSGNPVSCSQAIYGSNTTATAAPNLPSVTKQQDHITAGSSGWCSPSNLITVQHTYDTSGNPVTGTDGDNHLGCTLNASTYSACAVYDGLATHVTSATNAKNQTTTYGYDTTAVGGFGQWLTSTVDVNGQTTTYQYDILGRLIGIVRPGDSAGSPTVTYTYTNTCTQGATTPCLELDTATRFTVGGPVSTMKQWYDGWGHVVETQAPSPTGGQTIVTYTIYQNDNTNGNPVITSLPYPIATPAGYVNPDQTQPRSSTRVDGLDRTLGSVTYSNATTIVLSTSVSYTAAQGVQGITRDSSTPYDQPIILAAYNHQTISYTDALG